MVLLTPTPPLPVNGLVRQLDARQAARLRTAGDIVTLPAGHSLARAGEVMAHVYFPYSGLISLSGAVRGHPPICLAMVGPEGGLDMAVALGSSASPFLATVAAAGEALRLPLPEFRRLLQASPTLRGISLAFLDQMQEQFALGAACAHFHRVECRLARWLLMAQDRLQSARLALTHQQLSDILGVQRSAVTIAAGALMHQDLISYSRGNIHILSQARLRRAACSCYRPLAQVPAAAMPEAKRRGLAAPSANDSQP